MPHLLGAPLSLPFIFLRITLLLPLSYVCSFRGFKGWHTEVVEILASIRCQSPSILQLRIDAAGLPGACLVHGVIHLLDCLIVLLDDLLAPANHLEHLFALFVSKNLRSLGQQRHLLVSRENLLLVRIPLGVLLLLLQCLFALETDLMLLVLPAGRFFPDHSLEALLCPEELGILRQIYVLRFICEHVC